MLMTIQQFSRAILGVCNFVYTQSNIYDRGIKHIHCSSKNCNVDCLSSQPVMPATTDEEATTKVQIVQVSCEVPDTILIPCYKNSYE